MLPVAAAVTVLLTPVARRYALWRGLIDQPGPRRSHDRPVARGAGLAAALVLVAAALFGAPQALAAHVFAGSALLVALLGWWDDHRPLPVKARLGGQVIAVAGAIALLGPVTEVEFGGHAIGAGSAGRWIWTPVTAVAMIWVMNLFNFMDGSDGLATTQSLISGTVLAIVLLLAGAPTAAWIAAACAAVALGFLAWNRPPASVFLGDSGSLMFGWTFAFLGLVGTLDGTLSPALLFICLAPFVVDATATLLWRLARGERWYTAHRDHVYQVLIRAGWTHRRVLVALVLLNVLLVVPAVGLVLVRPRLDLIVALVLAGVLIGVWYFVHSAAIRKGIEQ